MNFLGVEIGGTKLQLVVGNQQAEIMERHRFQIEKARGAEGIREQIAQCLAQLQPRVQFKAGGIGFGGPVDWRTGRICCSHQIEGWSEFPLGDWISGQIQAPVRVDNDANTAGLAEAIMGAGRKKNPVFYVTMGSGVGGGLVADGSIYHGAIPGEAEIGHLRLDKSGLIVEERCSGWAADQLIRTQLATGSPSILRDLIGKQTGGEARYLSTALQQGDELAGAVLRQICDDIAFALSHVSHLTHPELIVLGGGLSLVGEPLRRGVQERLPKYLMEAFHPGPQIALAALGEDVVPVGALLLARQLL